MKKWILTCLITCLVNGAWADNKTIQMVVNYQQKGVNIPSDYVGLSYETKMILPDENGKYYFTPSNHKLVSMFKTLGIKTVR